MRNSRTFISNRTSIEVGTIAHKLSAKKTISVLLAFIMLLSQCPVGAWASTVDGGAGNDYSEGFVFVPADETDGNVPGDMEQADDESASLAEEAGQQEAQNDPIDGSNEDVDSQSGNDESGDVNEEIEESSDGEDNLKLYESESYQNGYILIWNFEQLTHVGSGLPVTSADQTKDVFGLGDPIWKDEDTPLTYAIDAAYMIACDIPFEDGKQWALPKDFKGSFTAKKSITEEDWSIKKEQPKLYDKKTDTFYLYNAIQIDAIRLFNEKGIAQAICSKDYDIQSFGTGDAVGLNTAGEPISYVDTNKYVLSELFSYDASEDELRKAHEKSILGLADQELEDTEAVISDTGDDDPLNTDDVETQTVEVSDPQSADGADTQIVEEETPDTQESDGGNEGDEAGSDASSADEDSVDDEKAAGEPGDEQTPVDQEPIEETGEDIEGLAPTDAEDLASLDTEEQTSSDGEEQTSVDAEEKPTSDAEEQAPSDTDEKPDVDTDEQETSDTEEEHVETEEEIGQSEQGDVTKLFAAKAYRHGYIFIYNYTQLQAVGSDYVITSLDHDAESFGTGEIIWKDQETMAAYTMDGNYVLANDISFPDGETWMLPDGFNGQFVPMNQVLEAIAEAAEPARTESEQIAVAEEYVEPQPENDTDVVVLVDSGLESTEDTVNVPGDSVVVESGEDVDLTDKATSEVVEDGVEDGKPDDSQTVVLEGLSGDNDSTDVGADAQPVEETVSDSDEDIISDVSTDDSSGLEAVDADRGILETSDDLVVTDDVGGEDLEKQESAGEPVLYDNATDTIYLYHPQQLITLQSIDRNTYPVMSLDYDAALFGAGKPIYLSSNSDTQPEATYLTYSDTHHYVLSASFNVEMSEQVAKLSEAESYRNGYIYIHHFDQLFEIASGHVITTTDHLVDEIGHGDVVWADESNLAVYAPDAAYVLVSDIPFPDGKTWVLPENFTGRFVLKAEAEKQTIDNAEVEVAEEGVDVEDADDAVPQDPDQPMLKALSVSQSIPEGLMKDNAEPLPEDTSSQTSEDASPVDDAGDNTQEELGDADSEEEVDQAPTLYDKETDTLYLYHPYQLMVLQTEDREEQPVMSMDYDMASFGMGKFLFPNGENEPYLCYGETHHYVLSATFTTNPPRRMLKAPRRAALVQGDHVDGRDFFGQTSVDIGGTTYILIGDRQQLDAINSDKTIRTNVCTPVFKATEGAVEVWRTNAHLTHDWVWLSEFDGSKELTDGNGYGDTAEEVIASFHALTSSAEIIYPGDADLIGDFSTSPLYDVDSSSYHKLDRPAGTATKKESSREIYFTVDQSTGYPVVNSTAVSSDPHNGTLSYTKDGNYIVFRNIDMSIGYEVTATDGRGEWKPLMFTGTMYGVKAESSDEVATLWDVDHTTMNLDTSRKPEISNFAVKPVVLTQFGDTRLDLNVQTGVGFFGTLTGQMNNTNLLGSQVVVRNLRLIDGTVDNPTVKADIDVTVVNGLLTAVGALLGTALDPVLKLLTGKDIGLREMLTGLLNARAKDPGSVATGGFAGRIIGNALVQDCDVERVAVTTVATGYEAEGRIVGKGGFVGTVEGTTRYDGLSNALGAVGSLLTSLLNVIPGLGLGDIVSVLLDNALPLKDLIPTGYTQPMISGCTVTGGTLSTEADKIGVGGFVGSMCGTEIINCAVRSSSVTVKADYFGGGFAGIERDAIIKGTLSGLGIDIGSLHPQSELIRCGIYGSSMTVTGGTYLGGFAGAMANSYGINDTISGGSMTVSGSGDFVGGFCGYAHLGTLFGFGSFLEDGESLLSTVKGLVTGLLGSGSDQTLLDVGGVAPSAVMGVKIDSSLTVRSEGAFVGGLVGRGNGVYITPSTEEYLRKLGKYDGDNPPALPIDSGEARQNEVTNLVSVVAGAGKTDRAYENSSFAGGIAGYLTSANVGGLLGNTAGIGQFLGFTVCETYINGIADGYTVSADRGYAGGGIGWAVGGDVYDVELNSLASVTANNYAGGFVGATGPGDLLNGGGLNLTLLGVELLSVNNLLEVGKGVRSTYTRANVTGIGNGFTVTELGSKTDIAEADYTAGGYAAQANSVTIRDCHVWNLLSVTANMHDGVSGGFVGKSAAGGLASLLDEGNSELLHALTIDGLLGAVPYMIPKYEGNSVSYVSGGFVQGDIAGGYAGDFQSGFVNRETADGEYESGHAYSNGTSSEPWSVYNIDHVWGGRYGGGWGGKVYSGALASAGGGISLLSSSGNSAGTLAIGDLLTLLNDYIPIINYAGVRSPERGFTVYAAHDAETPMAPATDGYAGGFIGYGSGVQISYSDVSKLRHGQPTEPTSFTGEDIAAYSRFGTWPAALESQAGGSYMQFNNSPATTPYAVAGARYAGGYIGHMDVGSAATLGGGLSLLGDALNLNNVLSALDVVVSTIEHSNVTGCPGGFNVIASSHINLMDGTYDAAGVAYAGGYAGKISGGHIQDGNVRLFGYIIGEIAAGGYAGEAVPGDAANVLGGDSSVLGGLVGVSGLASLVQDFIPTIRNSETSCIPCGGGIRAQSFSDALVKRGMAGGYIGHGKGVQIWGYSTDYWKNGTYSGETRECAAIRIRSVYGAEYAGGYCGLLESGSTAETGGISLLGGLIQANNVLGVLQAVYPTVRYGTVYGPMENVDDSTMAAWEQYVGQYGGFYPEIARGDFNGYAYGTHVVTGRHRYDNTSNLILSGCAGGFVGAMHSGVIRHSYAKDAKLVTAMRAAGGFVGEMQTKGGADLGSVNILGLGLNLGSMINVLNVFVPEISESGTDAYQQGLTVSVYGGVAEDQPKPGVGMAGGYCGASYGGQLGLHHENNSYNSISAASVWVHGLKLVQGVNTVGGFIGKSAAASVVDVSTGQASSGFLQAILDSLVSTAGDLANVAQATLSTIKRAEVTSVDGTWGLVVDGEYTADTTRYAYAAGGFAGVLEAAVLGERNDTSDRLIVNKLRSVNGGHYVGGFFGLGDTGSLASVGGSGSTSLLSLLNADPVNVLSAFRTYVYHASVYGVSDGITVTAHDSNSHGVMTTYQVSGAAGGFGGALVNGTVENSMVNNLNTVQAPHYAAGFVGLSDRNGVATVDGLAVDDEFVLGKLLTLLGLDLSANAQVLAIIGSTFKYCSADGYGSGFFASVTEPQRPVDGVVNYTDLTGSCAAGFIGFGDISQIENCTVENLKLAVSPQIAGGFIGRTSNAYLIGANVSSGLTEGLLQLVNLLLRVLYVDGLENIDLIKLPGEYAGLKLLADGDLLYVNLLGLKIGVSLVKNDPEYGGNQDGAIITIGSSTIKLPVTDGQIDTSSPNIQANLFEGNRTSVRSSTVTGIRTGYDVFGGGAGQNQDGSDTLGYAGGFVGFNESGYFSHDRMWLCDVVRGASGKVGPFSGYLKYNANTYRAAWYEGYDNSGNSNDNWYSIYRSENPELTEVKTDGGVSFGLMTPDAVTGMNRYDVEQYRVIETHGDLENAVESGETVTADLNAYASSAKAVLMLDTQQLLNPKSEAIKPDELKDPCDETFTLNVHKKWRDYNNKFATRPAGLEVEVDIIDVGTRPRAQLVQSIFPESGWTRADIEKLKAQYPGFEGVFGETNPLILQLQPNSGDEDFHWKAKLEGLPVAYRLPVMVDDGTGTLQPKIKLEPVFDESGNPLYYQELDEQGHPVYDEFGNPVYVQETDELGNPMTDASGNPVYVQQMQPVVDSNGDPVYETEVHYLQYVVTERIPDGYKLVQYEILEDTASVVILNELDGVVLPATGGQGFPLYMLAGIPLTLGIVLYEIYKRHRASRANSVSKPA